MASIREKDVDEFLKQNGITDDKPITAADVRRAIAKLIVEFDDKLEKSFDFHMKNYHRQY
jgi:hypothetical protein